MARHITVTSGSQSVELLRSDRAWNTVLRTLQHFCRVQPLAALGGTVVLLLVLTAIFAPQLAPHAPKDAAFPRYASPSTTYLMGTDHLGRDILSRVVWGARLSVYIGLTSVTVGVTLGALWGIIAAYFGGVLDTLSQRVVDAMMALPAIVLAISLMAVLGQAVNNVIIALAILFIPSTARIMRATTLSLKQSQYVEAARALGSSHWRVIFGHIIPNTMATYIVLFSVNLSYAIVVEASLSFLGLGAPPDEPSWGGMLTMSGDSLLSAPWMSLFPGCAITLVVFGMNMLGDGLRDVLDPRLRGSEGT